MTAITVAFVIFVVAWLVAMAAGLSVIRRTNTYLEDLHHGQPPLDTHTSVEEWERQCDKSAEASLKRRNNGKTPGNLG